MIYRHSPSITFHYRTETNFLANKTVKSTPRIPPKQGGLFKAGQEIRIEIPAQGYMNGGNTTLAFDVDLRYTPVAGDSSIIRFQNNIQSLFDRVSLMYGSTPLEDIAQYNQIVRCMTEWTTTGDFDQGSVNDGIGHKAIGRSGYVRLAGNTENDDSRPIQRVQPVNIRQAYIHGISFQKGTSPAIEDESTLIAPRQLFMSGDGFGCVPYTPSDLAPTSELGTMDYGQEIVISRRYVVQLNLGLLLQGKLLPVKYMASQLAISIRLAADDDCIYWQRGYKYSGTARLDNFNTTKRPTYTVQNIQLIPELLEFDSSYDQTFLQGLQQGVPLLFSSFNTFQFASTGSALVTLSIPERSRSVKSVYTLQRNSQASMYKDSGATFYTTGVSGIATDTDNAFSDAGSTLQEYQYRIGGRMFPASPVQCSLNVGSAISNGGAEAYVELAKALITLGDFRLSTPLNVLSWASPVGIYYDTESVKRVILPEYDGSYDVYEHGNGGLQLMTEVESAGTYSGEVTIVTSGNEGFNSNYSYMGRSAAGINSCCFAMAINLETSNGVEISGLNAEEQSDISITMRWSSPQDNTMQFLVYTYYDAMLVLFENNVIQLIK